MDIANKLVRIVIRTRRLEDVIALSSVNKQFFCAATPIWRVLSAHHDFALQEVREEWRKKFKATNPEHHHFMVRAAALDAARSIDVNQRGNPAIISALRFMHHAAGMIDGSLAPEAPRLIVDGLWSNPSNCGGFILNSVKAACGQSAFDASKQLAELLNLGIPRMMKKTLEIDILRVLIAFTSCSLPGKALPGSLVLRLSLAFKFMPPKDKWTLARWLLRHHQYPVEDDDRYKGERVVWNHVLRQVLAKFEDRSVFEQDKHPDLSLILWQSCEIAQARPTDLSETWLTKLMDAGVREQLRAYPYLSKSDLISRRDAFPEGAPWPLVFLAWISHYAESKNAKAILQEIERGIDDKSIRFIKPAQFQKLKTCCVHNPAAGLRDWIDLRTRSSSARAQTTLDKKFG
ncbi:MAG: hypothetical protein JWP36_2229 [Paucimonas sp.]|nr:hypothetical protein [Paucimonas sp.]